MNPDKQKTLAIVISSLRMGGAERVASLVANELASEYRIVLFVWNDKERFYPLNPNVEIRILATKKRGVLGNVLRVFKLWRAFKSERVDLSISFIHQTNILSILASKMARIPCIATEHSIFSALDSKFWCILRYLTYYHSDTTRLTALFFCSKCLCFAKSCGNRLQSLRPINPRILPTLHLECGANDCL